MNTSHPIDGFKCYPAYKPSGVEWVGEVPGHWEVRRLKNWVGINEAALPETAGPDCQFTYLEIGAVGTGLLLSQPATVRFGSAPSRARRIVRTGDTIVSTVRTYLKATWFAGEVQDDLICSTGFAVLTPRNEIFPKFISYVAQSDSFTDRVTAASVGTAYPAIAESKLGSFHVALPPLPEQRAIVRYLDYVDRRIRRYLAAKRKLIALLEEERQAVINQAVTRGLDPNVRLKPSGVEWLGDVPEHWDTVRARFLFKEVDTRSTSGEETHLSMSQALGLVPSYLVEQSLISDSYAGGKLCQEGDLVLNRLKAHLGVFALAKQAGVISPDYSVFRKLGSVHMEYFFRVLRLPTMRTELRIRAKGIVEGFWRLYTDDFFDIRLPVPPFAEQLAIVEHLDEATTDIDAAISRARRQVGLVEEYRTRLIVDVVTGKLDVRDAAAQLPDEAEDDVPIGEGGPHENGLVEGLYDAEKEPAIAEEVTI